MDRGLTLSDGKEGGPTYTFWVGPQFAIPADSNTSLVAVAKTASPGSDHAARLTGEKMGPLCRIRDGLFVGVVSDHPQGGPRGQEMTWDAVFGFRDR
jgi:hypothetical protein